MIGFSSACAAAVANTKGSRNSSTAAGIVQRIHMAQPPSTEGNLSLRGYRTPTPGLVQFAKELSTAGRAKGRDAFRRGPSRPGRNRTCNPRFWSALPATPALKPLLIFNDLGPGQQRRRRWTTPALTLFLAPRRG